MHNHFIFYFYKIFLFKYMQLSLTPDGDEGDRVQGKDYFSLEKETKDMTLTR